MSELIHIFSEMARRVDLEKSHSIPANLDLTQQFFMVSGVPVIPKPPRQQTGCVNRLYLDGMECVDEFHTAVQEYARRGDAADFVIVDPKALHRTHKKAMEDYNGDYARVCDIQRASIIVDSAKQYKKVTNLLLPGRNSSVVRLQDGFASPDKDGGLRRVLANVVMSNGHVTEIQVRHAVMEKSYERSAPLWRDIRAMRARLSLEGDKMSAEEQTNLRKSLTHKEHRRFMLHENAAKKMDNVVIDRTFHSVDGFPVLKTHDRFTGEFNAVVPDVQSGNFVTDNRFLPLLEDKNRNTADISRETFIRQCVAMVSSSQAKACLRVA